MRIHIKFFSAHTNNLYSGIILLFFLCAGCNSTVQAQNKSLQTTSDVLIFAFPAAVLTSTLIKGDTEGTWQFTKGFALNQAVTLGLKYAIGKDRPYNNGERAFPSGHTSTTFQSAAFLQRRYGWKYGIPAYTLAAFTGYCRIEAQKHDGWDVLAGAVVGIGSSYLFTTPYQKEHMELTFSRWDDTYLLGFAFKF
jgi:membrane-associated phospholipid phosphatase